MIDKTEDATTSAELVELLRLGHLGLELGYWQQAEAYFDAVLAQAPGNLEALLGKAKASRNPEAALTLVRAVLQAQPNHPEALRLERQLQQEAHPPTAPLVPAAPAGRGRLARLLVALALLLLAMVLAGATGLWPFSRSATRRAALATTLLIVPTDLNRIWTGSGSIISADGLVLTNYHVIADPHTRELANADGLAYAGLTRDPRRPPWEWYIAALVAVDPDRDLAVLRLIATTEGKSVGKERFPEMPLGDPRSLNLGQTVSGLGYPTLGGNTLTLTRGTMAGFASRGDGVRLGKTDSELLPGSSGGAVLDERGRLVGVITGVYADQETQGRLSYFVLLSEAQPVIQEAKRAGRPAPDLQNMVDRFPTVLRALGYLP